MKLITDFHLARQFSGENTEQRIDIGEKVNAEGKRFFFLINRVHQSEVLYD